jgi:outer membrane protein OmpA-like peptidoglycan-associated protein
VYMLNEQTKQRQIKAMAVSYQEMQIDLYKELKIQFQSYVDRGLVSIDPKSLAVTFTEPEVLFGMGSAKLTPTFIEILDDFFPRYIGVLHSERFRDHIEEIRIEGHTSSPWKHLTGDQAYFANMMLSQQRTRAVLRYGLGLIIPESTKSWTRTLLTANGLSSSKRVLRANCTAAWNRSCEDYKASRRVTFRTKTKAEQRIVQIIEGLQKDEL